MTKSWQPDIYNYLDYRQFIQAYYSAAKENTKSMSFRYLSRRAGFSSPNFIKLVMDGQRNLSEDGARRVAGALNLKGEAINFFCSLVAFNQATNAMAQNEAYERIAASKRFRQARHLDHSMFEYLSRWYYPAIREMAARADFKDDPTWIAKQLLPPITTSEAKRAMDVLFSLELIERDKQGKIQRKDPIVTTGHEVRSLAIGNYHRQMIELGGQSIERVDSQHRDISAMTACIDAKTAAEIKKRIHSFRETIIDLCENTPQQNLVYQMNIQLFPMNKIPSDES